MELIKRKDYLNTLFKIKNTPDIKVITGVRRSGKSKLLLSYIDELKEHEKNANIVYINLQDSNNENLLNYHNLNEFLLLKHNPKKKNYLFIDEVQLCNNFEYIINSIHSKEIYDIYITGSNAFLLSSDLATLFTGRTFSLEVLPFSYNEFLVYHKLNNTEKSFNEYVKVGGFAGSYIYDDIQLKYNYLKNDVYNSIINRDITSKYQIKDLTNYYNLTNFMIDNISNLTSLRKLENYFKSNVNSISHNTIAKYVYFLCDAFVFYKVGRYDIKGKKYLSTENKYYLVDHSLKYSVLGSKNNNIGNIYENIVYIELRRRGYEIYIGKLYNNEIDFIAIKQNEYLYIQVSSYIDNEDTLERELLPLRKIKDAYPKILIARTHSPLYTIDGIKVYDIANWLNGEE